MLTYAHVTGLDEGLDMGTTSIGGLVSKSDLTCVGVGIVVYPLQWSRVQVVCSHPPYTTDCNPTKVTVSRYRQNNPLSYVSDMTRYVLAGEVEQELCPRDSY
jgi:hypothetical protein